MQLGLGLLYCCFGLLATYILPGHCRVCCSAPSEDIEGLQQKDTWRSEPYTNFVTLSDSLPAPLCCLQSSSDAHLVWWQMRWVSIAVVAQPAMHVAVLVSCLGHGQIMWGMAILAAVLLGSRDPFLVRGFRALRGSLSQGYHTLELLQHEYREGVHVATFIAAITVASLLNASPGSMDLPTMWLRLCSAACSLLYTVPTACVAEDILVQAKYRGLDMNDFYAQEEARAYVGHVQKYGLAGIVLFFGTLGGLGASVQDHLTGGLALACLWLYSAMPPAEGNIKRALRWGVLVALFAALCVQVWDHRHDFENRLLSIQGAAMRGDATSRFQALLVALGVCVTVVCPVHVAWKAGG